MRLTIIVPDKTIGVDGFFYSNIEQDLSWIPSNVHAVQWNETHGEIEFNDGSPNEIIEDLGIYSQAEIDFNNEVRRIQEYEEAMLLAAEAVYDWWSDFRKIRNQKLYDSDWTQIPGDDNPLTEEKKEEWRTYRQALRDIPDSVTDPKPYVKDLEYEGWPSRPQ